MINFDAVKHIGFSGKGHMDANETLFFARQLEFIEQKVYEFKKRELKYRDYFPVSNADNPGAEKITYRMYDKVGMAKIISNYSDDLPRSDVFAKEYSQNVKGLGIAFAYNSQELRAAQFANISLDLMKAAAARRGHREAENRLAWHGDDQYGIIGLLNNPNIPLTPAGNGVSTHPDWARKTPDEIIADVRIATSQIRVTSKGLYEADTMLLPQAQYDLIANTPRASFSDKTILAFLRDSDNGFGLKTIEAIPVELAGTFPGSKDGAFLYAKDPEVLELRIPLELIMHPVQPKGLEFEIPGESRFGGLVVRYPIATLFFTEI